MNNDLARKAETALRAIFAEKGLPVSKLPWVMAQLALETAGFKSRVSSTNNLSGIKFVKGNKFGAIVGILSPEGDYYAAYPGGVKDWARQYVYEITKKSNPLGADTATEFVARLKANGYFGNHKKGTPEGIKEENAYLKALLSWKGQISKFLGTKWPEIAVSGVVLISVLVFFIVNQKNLLK